MAPAVPDTTSSSGSAGQPAELILASQSLARRRMLAAAGVAFRAVTAEVDEDALRADLQAGKQAGAQPEAVATALARAKAEDVSRRHPQALVIGADQVLALGSELIVKAPDMAAARAKLARLAGRGHALHSAVALAHGGRCVWHHMETARLAMRPLADPEIEAYLERAGDDVLAAVGCYELEGLGLGLFERIEGDYFTILGMPLLALLAQLRRHGIAAF